MQIWDSMDTGKQDRGIQSRIRGRGEEPMYDEGMFASTWKGRVLRCGVWIDGWVCRWNTGKLAERRKGKGDSPGSIQMGQSVSQEVC